MSDTPRTDACKTVDSWNLYRELERENAELRAKIGELEKAFAPNFVDELHAECIKLERENAALKQRILDDNKAYGCELRDPSGTIWDHAKELQIENANLREDKERLDWLAVQHRRERQSFSEDASKDESVMLTVFHADGTFTVVQGPTFRAAIDSARKEAQP